MFTLIACTFSVWFLKVFPGPTNEIQSLGFSYKSLACGVPNFNPPGHSAMCGSSLTFSTWSAHVPGVVCRADPPSFIDLLPLPPPSHSTFPLMFGIIFSLSILCRRSLCLLLQSFSPRPLQFSYLWVSKPLFWWQLSERFSVQVTMSSSLTSVGSEKPEPCTYPACSYFILFYFPFKGSTIRGKKF